VLVGVSGLELDRRPFYEKELAFRVSSSYGPGRYDPEYEERGRDYPLAYVRWTAQRNFEAVLDLMADGRLHIAPLVSHEFPFERAPDAYDLLTGGEPSLGVVLSYREPAETDRAAKRTVTLSAPRPAAAPGSALVVGAGNYAVRTLLPELKKTGIRLRSVVSARRFGFEMASADFDEALADPEVDTVFVLTRHDSHADLAIRALRAGRHVFVEKPLALTEEQLGEIERALEGNGRLLTVGFNRRFAPAATETATLLAGRAAPLSVVMTVNAGAIPKEHWAHDPAVGGGRVLGEGCHFIDLARFLIRSPIETLDVRTARDGSGRPVEDIAHVTLSFAEGSTGAIHYLANGSRTHPKERIECFFDGRTVVIDNWRRAREAGRSSLRPFKGRMEKGHAELLGRWVEAIRTGGPPPIPYAELFEVSRWSIEAGRMAAGG
jgi:predicted dehydrogenase